MKHQPGDVISAFAGTFGVAGHVSFEDAQEVIRDWLQDPSVKIIRLEQEWWRFIPHGESAAEDGDTGAYYNAWPGRGAFPVTVIEVEED